MAKVVHVVGARPNFMKLAPVLRALEEDGGFVQTLVHTGQHYDANMSEVFFQQLGIPSPDINLEVGAGTQVQQLGQIMLKFEEVIRKIQPDVTVVYGDVTSTVAAALASNKNNVPIAHVEAGLRSRDRSMPEEINRLVTDQLADLLFTPSKDGNANLVQEGISPEKIHFVGNVMIDTLRHLLPSAHMPEGVSGPYILVTLHRPSNVDDEKTLRRIVSALSDIAAGTRIVFPVHPRTRKRLESMGLEAPRGIFLMEPVGYLEFLALQKNALAVVTDSGGIQEETTFLGVPCLTLRENTERPITLDVGTNLLVGRDMELLKFELRKAVAGKGKRGSIPPLWDGRAGERIAEILKRRFGQ